jgi:hypothetical protein
LSSFQSSVPLSRRAPGALAGGLAAVLVPVRLGNLDVLRLLLHKGRTQAPTGRATPPSSSASGGARGPGGRHQGDDSCVVVHPPDLKQVEANLLLLGSWADIDAHSLCDCASWLCPRRAT